MSITERNKEMQPSIEDFARGYILITLCNLYQVIRKKFRKHFPRKKLLLVSSCSVAPVGEAYPKFSIECTESSIVNREIVGDRKEVSKIYATRYGIDFFIPVWFILEDRLKYGYLLKIIRCLSVDYGVYLAVGFVIAITPEVGKFLFFEWLESLW